MKNYTKSIGLGLAIASLAWSAQIQAATFLTFVDDQPGFLAAIGPGTTTTTENFTSVVDGQPVGVQGSPSTWNGFTVETYGTNPGLPYGPSKYCALLNSPACISWNVSAPAIPGIYGSVAKPTDGILFKLTSPTIAAVSFDFVDWNDSSERSQLIATASDGTETVVQGPINAASAAAQTFGVTLSPADISAGIFVTQIRWVGLVGGSEVVGFYDFKTYTNPVITNTPPVANPDTYAMPTGPLPMNLLVNDSDPDGDTLQITSINGVALTPGVAQSIPVPEGTVQVAVDGTLTFVPTANANGPVTFPYEISDGRGGVANSTVTITARPNLPPVANPDVYPMPSSPLTLGLLSNDSDPDGDILQVTSINGTPVTPGVAQSIPAPSGTVDIAVDGTITFIPAPNANGPVTFPYEISDGRGGTSNSTVTLTAKPVPPVTTPAPVPALGNWALIGLSALIAIFGLSRRRQS